MAALRSSHCLRVVSAWRSFSCSGLSGIDGLGEGDKFQTLCKGIDARCATFEQFIAPAHGVLDELTEGRHGGVGGIGLHRGGHEFDLRGETLALATDQLKRRFVKAKMRSSSAPGGQEGDERRRGDIGADFVLRGFLVSDFGGLPDGGGVVRGRLRESLGEQVFGLALFVKSGDASVGILDQGAIQVGGRQFADRAQRA